ncbi:DUF4037 domain-containing protein [Paenibacillus ginsengarvi]|uniref:DUF4037 domain-containing protein n=1 Tax=Paenibacillus ginsengarvi TaxID=400777 RepID=A0A3B0CJC8_9BACL|nr:DUF4037 domain-containing protein [Paenibacillus ginsengarvi]RKN84798.1 DUF4037 domain-containing protein [Paenibacillus ginsengarvi]
MKSFIPGIELSRCFYEEVVAKLVNEPHAAALIGEGSEVLGFDQPRSTDHSWGPRMQLFVRSSQVEAVRLSIEDRLPATFKGFPVQFHSLQTGTVRHHVEVTTVEEWVAAQLRIDSFTEPTVEVWLSMPQQHLLQFTSGAVFRDDSGELTRIRERFSWYPADVWLWMMASQWHLIGNVEPLLGRTAEAGDTRGSILVSCRLVRLIMELCFLQEKRYWPYMKWFGTAFSRLFIAPQIGPILDRILQSPDQQSRENGVTEALEIVARRHNALGLTRPVLPRSEPFQVGINNAVRPYRVLNTGQYVQACKEAIADETIRKLVHVGAIDQLTHADDALINFTSWTERLKFGYRAETDAASLQPD